MTKTKKYTPKTKATSYKDIIQLLHNTAVIGIDSEVSKAYSDYQADYNRTEKARVLKISDATKYSTNDLVKGEK